MNTFKKSLSILSPTAAALATTLAAVSLTPSAVAGTIRHDRDDVRYQTLAGNYPGVGYFSAQNASSAWGCSGTLIAHSYVLTAAHCLRDPQGWMTQGTFWLGDQPYSVNSRVFLTPWLQGNVEFDIAVLSLSQNVLNVNPAKLYAGRDENLKRGTYVGYGMTGTGITGAVINDGIKRAGGNTIEVGTRFGYSPNLLVSDFTDPDSVDPSTIVDPNNPRELRELEYQLARGDSGGGLFIDGFVAGVQSFIGSNAKYGDISASVRVSSRVGFIRGMANFLAQRLGRPNPTIASGGPITTTGRGGVNRQAVQAPLVEQYNWFDENIFTLAYVINDVDFEQYENGQVFEEETLVDPPKDVPEPSMLLGTLAFLGILTRLRRQSASD